MHDIFLSYASADYERVRRLIHAFERHGWSVWWDRTIPPGKTFDQVIEEALDAARCVVVVWSRASVASRWVRTEAGEGMQRDILVPVLIEPDVRLPLEFRRVQAAHLMDWQDTGPHLEFARLLQAVTDLIGPPVSVAASSPAADPLVSAPPVVLPVADEDSPRSSRLRQTPPQPVQADTRGQAPVAAITHHTHPGRRRVWLGGVVACVLLAVLYGARLMLLPKEVPSPTDTPAQEVSSPKPSEPPRLTSTLTNSLGMKFVLIPAGELQMGSANGFEDEKPVHTVRISQAFYLGKHEVTQAQWQAVMGSNPSQFAGDPQRPVERVSWDDVQAFVQKLNAREGGAQYRLPTEAEWEYAARAGSQTAYSFGDDAAQLGQYAWYDKNAGGTTHPVGQLQPNAWGLYDMHGNVWEWVQDWYGAYPAAAAVDPAGPAAGSYRVIRGGSWFYDAGGCRSAFRHRVDPGCRDDFLGLRLLRTAP
jgi:formylglycine-generating enzyme required for sulfatase activity